MLGTLKGEGDEAIDVQTIDRYQGSENRIVIVSLVRSNTEGKVGHLMALNRLCVTVSRARAGLYICGDADTLSMKSPHWRTLIEYFKNQSCIGDNMILICPRHPKEPSISLHNDDAENFSPHVCGTICNATLECGHQCTQTCHYGKHALCKRKVQHIFPSCQHSTEKLCSDPDISLKCLEEVWIIVKKCGHMKKCLCWEKTGNVRSAMMCEIPCGLTLSCMHPCNLLCGQDCGSKPCPACARIEQIKARKERELQIKQIKEKMQDIDDKIEKLKSEPEIGPVFKGLQPAGETAAEYRMVQDRTEKFIQPTHKQLPVVTRIQKVINAKLELNFLQAKRDLTDVLAPTQMLFHGTDDAGVTGITTTGFRLPSASKNNMFGVGCYFATDSSKSAQELYTKGSNKLLLCEVLLGRPWSVTSALPDLTLKKVRKSNFDSVFSMRNSRASGGTEFDEYIIYNPSQAIPRYVVHYQNMDCFTPELPSPLKNVTLAKFGRRLLNADASSTYKGLTSDDMHFRIAESQFYRMCKDRKQKVEKVEYTWNQELDDRYQIKKQLFEKEKKAVNELLVFHGTTKESIDKIVREGFKVGGEKGVPIRCGAAYGHGVYTAASPEISIPYSQSSKMMLLSIALCGKLNVDYTLGGSEDIFVVKQGDQLLPRYIVHFQST
ncbi:hypothetical protein L7F22_020704 [Adiantum nelumboides]|nr:hypothetical protein [Adiantum nelumboides]